MSSPVHYRVEVLYDTTWGPACGFGAHGRLTEDPTEITCRKCLTLCGFEAVPDEQLTDCQPDPLRQAA